MREVLKYFSNWIEEPRTWKIGVFLGFLVSLFCFIPYIIQGKDVIIGIHDNLDSDLVWFHILSQSPNTFTFSNEATVDAVMGGELPRNALPPALNGVTVLFSLFSSFVAYITNYLIVRVVGIISMYFFLTQYLFSVIDEKVYAIPISLAYGLLPYHGLHPGIAVSGLPILALSFANLHEGNYSLLSYSLLVVYGLYSSLLYVGMFVLAIVGAGALWRYLRGHSSSAAFSRLTLGVVLLSFTYVLAELNLFNLYFLSDFVSHREEYNPIKLGTSTDFMGAIYRSVDHFLSGHYHAPSLHNPFLILGVLGAFGVAGYRWYAVRDSPFSSQNKIILNWLAVSSILLVAISCLYGFWNWEPFVRARTGLGLLSKVQFQRFYWLAPFLWTFAFSLGVVYIRRQYKNLRPVVFLAATIQLIFVVSTNSELQKNYYRIFNVEKITGVEISSPTYREFYSPQLFREIKREIDAPTDEYRVVSVGLFPDITAYNGFHTLDSYQRLYPLYYKHEFRRIISPELKKLDEIQSYFDYWGSRCYMFTSELKRKYYIPKSQSNSINVNYNTRYAKGMGAEYVISSVPISNKEENNLKMLNTFENTKSPYRIHLYKIKIGSNE